MSDFRTVQSALTEIGMTADEMDIIWSYMRDKNWKVNALTNSNKDWSNLTPFRYEITFGTISQGQRKLLETLAFAPTLTGVCGIVALLRGCDFCIDIL